VEFDSPHLVMFLDSWSNIWGSWACRVRGQGFYRSGVLQVRGSTGQGFYRSGVLQVRGSTGRTPCIDLSTIAIRQQVNVCVCV
jgi:hypothetical protein